MFVIMHNNGLYFHNKGRIILFETQDEAQYFLELFSQYSMQRLAKEGNPMAIMQVHMVLQSECKVMQPNFDINKVKCGTVLMKELFEKMGYKND